MSTDSQKVNQTLHGAQLEGTRALTERAVVAEERAEMGDRDIASAAEGVAAVKASHVIALNDQDARTMAIPYAIFVPLALAFDAALLRQFGIEIIWAGSPVAWWLGYLEAAIVSSIIICADCIAGTILGRSKRPPRSVRALTIMLLLAVPTAVVIATAVARWNAWSAMTNGHRWLTVGAIALTVLVHACTILGAEAGVVRYVLAQWRLSQANRRLDSATNELNDAQRDLRVVRINLELADLPESLLKAAIAQLDRKDQEGAMSDEMAGAR